MGVHDGAEYAIALILNTDLTHYHNDKQIYHLDSLTITENASQDQLQLLATGKSGANKIKFNGILSLLDDGNNILGITQALKILETEPKRSEDF